jgi:hypothetical protein
MRFSDGVDFDFNDSSITLLEAGARVLLVKNQAAFEFRYGTALSDRIIGEFQNGTKLKNEGERLAISTNGGESLRDFTYDNRTPWPESPGEGGFSLVLRAPETNPDHALVANWTLGPAFGGTPGIGEDLNFITWAGAFGNPEPGSDEDLDGRVALIEYAMGTNPTISDPMDPQLEFGEFLTFSFRRDPLAEDVTLSLEQSSDLNTWLPASDNMSLTGETDNLDGTTTLIYRSNSPAESAPRFLRIRATLN